MDIGREEMIFFLEGIRTSCLGAFHVLYAERLNDGKPDHIIRCSTLSSAGIAGYNSGGRGSDAVGPGGGH